MNLKEYIESGILEAYALGSLSDEDRRDVESKLAIHQELRAELESIELAMEGLYTKAGRKTSDEVKNSILKDIHGPAARAIAMPSPRSIVLWKYATAASVLFAVSASILAYVFWSNWKRTETDLEERIALTRQMAEDLNTVSNRLDKIEDDLDIYDNPQFQKVVMKGTPDSPGSMALVYWNKDTREVFLSVQNLKEITQEQQYQLWAIVNGKPVDLGVFDMPSGGLSKMYDASGATAFAITIEPRGGKPTPTMETMQVIGST